MSPVIEKTLTALGSVVLLAVMLYGCQEGLARERNREYQQCLHWQSEGHSIQCNPEDFGISPDK